MPAPGADERESPPSKSLPRFPSKQGGAGGGLLPRSNTLTSSDSQHVRTEAAYEDRPDVMKDWLEEVSISLSPIGLDGSQFEGREPIADLPDRTKPPVGVGETVEREARIGRRYEILGRTTKDRDHWEKGENDKDMEKELPDVLGPQEQLNQYRERLARDLERREPSARSMPAPAAEISRVSPIQEETASSPSQTTSSGHMTISTESAGTIRGGFTPGFLPMAATPSYPFPRMATPGATPPYLPSQHTTSSLGGAPQGASKTSFEGLTYQEKALSGASTPPSNLIFEPAGATPYAGNVDFPSPDLYELSLMLSSEPGLDAWWKTVVGIMKNVFKAERVTLAVPADPTDIENVPWGQKATYNEHNDDGLSLGYRGRGSSFIPSSNEERSPLPSNIDDSERLKASVRPALQSRHSFTAYEENKERMLRGKTLPAPRRPVQLSRSKSHLLPHQSPFENVTVEPGQPNTSGLRQAALQEHDAAERLQAIPSWEVPLMPEEDDHGRVLSVLQALDYEADPLIDHTGVMRVLERGNVIALTRSYPYLQNPPANQPAKPKPEARAEGVTRRFRKQRPESISKLSSLLGAVDQSRSNPKSRHTTSAMSHPDDDSSRPTTPKYEEYEQAPSSPWSQSPAPSPAVRADPKENPFFTDAMVDEESFNPAAALPADYSSMRPPEAIGIDHSWTVLRLPLTQAILGSPGRSFKLDATLMEQKSNIKGHGETSAESGEASVPPPSPDGVRKVKAAPIAILSILSPIIPYPLNFRRSLEHLSPHLAASFSLCRQYTNLQTELAGLQRRRPQTSGFGALGTDGRPITIADPSDFADMLPPEEITIQTSLAGSITSPSEYSGISKSATGSPGGTPSWDQGSLSILIEKQQQQPISPSPTGDESYFSAKQRPPLSQSESLPGAAVRRKKKSSKENSPIDKRTAIRLVSGRTSNQETSHTQDSLDNEDYWEGRRGSFDDMMPSLPNQRQATSKELRDSSRHMKDDTTTERATKHTLTDSLSRSAEQRGHHRHTLLHSYGADFASTFQSLPSSSSVASRPTPNPLAPSRTGSMTGPPADMPPPSDRLKSLMLDSLPCHVFVALPRTGEIVWVNSRYLTYRGQSVPELIADPWASIHPDDRVEYLKAWSSSLQTGEQFSRTVRIKRFDREYRWFHARAVASRDKRGVIMQFLGSYMDIHDQHIAELKAARQEEIQASEEKFRLLANLIPQIIFTATEDDGITFANDQWKDYTGQNVDNPLGLGFMDFVHPEDLAKCHIPTGQPPTPLAPEKVVEAPYQDSNSDEDASSESAKRSKSKSGDSNLRGIHQALSRQTSRSNESVYEIPTADLAELAKDGVIKTEIDGTGRLSYTTEVRLRSKSGEYRWHLIRCVLIDSHKLGAEVNSYFGSATDINDHKIIEAQLKEAMESKSRFLSNMSHEIRTPLIGISGMVSFLQDTTLNEEQRDYTNTIQTSANSLLMIINDILDLSKVNAGMMKLKHEWFHTRSLIEDVNELVWTMAAAKRLELNYVIEEAVPTWVKGDRVRLRQVLLNIIGNAIKFTTTGEVFSRCRVSSRENARLQDNEIMLEFAIIDTGRGFSKEEAELIFKPFSQIDGSSTRQHGGSGLGLVISKQLVELHGGSMQGAAVPGKGSTFTFTAKFELPTEEDHPDLLASPQAANQRVETLQGGIVQPIFKPSVAGLHGQTPMDSPETDTLTSSGSSDPSVHSGRTHLTDKSSVSSVNVGLVSFSQAARASGHDLSQMKLEMPSGRSSPDVTPTPGNPEPLANTTAADLRPPMYSILIICPQTHSREATTQHIEMTLPKDVPYQITAKASEEGARALIAGDDAVIFTHIVINLQSAEEIIRIIDQTTKSAAAANMMILILSDSIQRQQVFKLAAGTKFERLLSEKRVCFIYKPVKPSRFAVIFDPQKVRDFSIDRNRSSAARMVESQKASYLEIGKRMGGKGFRVLLVEDNIVNQKVLEKYLKKVGVEVSIAADGVECIDMVFSQPRGYWSLILCDLHMPRKDGYQACREIRQWEKENGHEDMPIIALSANVMSDVQDKCVAAGFSDYVTKPVDFIDLSRVMSKYF